LPSDDDQECLILSNKDPDLSGRRLRSHVKVCLIYHHFKIKAKICQEEESEQSKKGGPKGKKKKIRIPFSDDDEEKDTSVDTMYQCIDEKLDDLGSKLASQPIPNVRRYKRILSDDEESPGLIPFHFDPNSLLMV
jgi:hypothetical protein